MTSAEIKKELRKYATKERKEVNMRFFKTGKGEYGEGDQFLGVTVPHTRLVEKKFKDAPWSVVKDLVQSKIHEERLLGLFMMVSAFKKDPDNTYKRYLANRKYVNNWDLVDSSAHKIVGEYLVDRDRSLLYKLAESKNIWDRRIAVIATFAFIGRGDLKDTFKLAHLLRDDEHDLMHKAVGWALREAGKKDEKKLTAFLDKHAKHMPRTMLRYSIEKLSPSVRKHYMKKD